MELTENMLSESVQKLSNKMIENWESNNADITHQFSQEFEAKIKELIEEK